MSARLAGGPPDRGALFVVSGPSGVGKSTLVREALARYPQIRFSVSATTRLPRPGEEHGVHYRFVEDAQFSTWVEAGAFLEHATVYDRRYGTLLAPTQEALSGGTSLLLDIDVQGARQVRARMPSAVLVFVAPPSLRALEARLRARGSEDEAAIARRMELAAEQLRGCPEYDYVLINDELDVAQRTFEAVVVAELTKVERRPHQVERLSQGLA